MSSRLLRASVLTIAFASSIFALSCGDDPAATPVSDVGVIQMTVLYGGPAAVDHFRARAYTAFPDAASVIFDDNTLLEGVPQFVGPDIPAGTLLTLLVEALDGSNNRLGANTLNWTVNQGINQVVVTVGVFDPTASAGRVEATATANQASDFTGAATAGVPASCTPGAGLQTLTVAFDAVNPEGAGSSADFVFYAAGDHLTLTGDTGPQPFVPVDTGGAPQYEFSFDYDPDLLGPTIIVQLIAFDSEMVGQGSIIEIQYTCDASDTLVAAPAVNYAIAFSQIDLVDPDLNALAAYDSVVPTDSTAWGFGVYSGRPIFTLEFTYAGYDLAGLTYRGGRLWSVYLMDAAGNPFESPTTMPAI